MKTKVCPKCKLKYPKIKRKCPDCGFVKPRSVGDLKKDLWNVFSIYIRTRDCLRTTGCASWGLCISCGNLTNYSKYDIIHLGGGL